MPASEYTIERLEAWPFPRAHEILQQGAAIWLEIAQEHADNLLGAVPPIYVQNGFMVGEADSWSPTGTRYATVLEFEGRSFLAVVSRHELDESWRNGLLAAIEAERAVLA